MAGAGKRPALLTKRRLVWLALLLVIVGGVTAYVLMRSRPTLIDHTLIAEADFPVYTPQRPPSGYTLDASRTNVSSTAMTYTFTAKDSQSSIVVTVQPLPANFDMQKLIGSGTVTTTTTSNGTLYDLSAGGKTQYALNTGDALLFFTSTTAINAATINALVADLARAN